MEAPGEKSEGIGGHSGLAERGGWGAPEAGHRARTGAASQLGRAWRVQVSSKHPEQDRDGRPSRCGDAGTSSSFLQRRLPPALLGQDAGPSVWRECRLAHAVHLWGAHVEVGTSDRRKRYQDADPGSPERPVPPGMRPGPCPRVCPWGQDAHQAEGSLGDTEESGELECGALLGFRVGEPNLRSLEKGGRKR